MARKTKKGRWSNKSWDVRLIGAQQLTFLRNSIRPMLLTFFNSRMTPWWNIRQAWTSFSIISPSLPLKLTRTPHLPNAQVNAQRHCWNGRKLKTVCLNQGWTQFVLQETILLQKQCMRLRRNHIKQIHNAQWKFSPKSHGDTIYATDIIPLTTREIHHQIEFCTMQSLYHINKIHARPWPIETIPVVLSQIKSDSAMIDINHWIFEMRPTILHLTVSKKTAEMQLCRLRFASVTLDKL